MNSTDPKERAPQVEMLLGVFKHMAQYSNQNLSRNVDYLFVIENKNLRIWSGVLVRQNNVAIRQNLNLRINMLARDDERESVLLYLNADVWMIILQFLTNNELYQLKFLCRRFYMFVSLSSFFKKLDYYREIVDTDKLYECFIDWYDNFLFSNLSQEFQLSTLSFLKNHLEPVKNYFLCSNVLFHLFNYAVNHCALCSRLYIDPLIDCVDLHNTDLRYKLIKSSIFAYDVKQLFKNNFITQFKLNICYKRLKQYTVLNSDQKRCLQLSVFQNECDIIIKYCEVLIRIFLSFFVLFLNRLQVLKNQVS